MKSITVEKFGIKIVITYKETLSEEKIAELKRDAEITCVRIRNKRDE